MGNTQNRLIEKNRKKENDMALMMIAIVFVFVICNIFSGIFWISFSYCLVSKVQYIYYMTVRPKLPFNISKVDFFHKVQRVF